MTMQTVIDANDGQSKPGVGARYNAVTHGLTAKTLVLPNEDLKAFRAKVQDFKDSLETRTPLEDDLAERAAEASWRLTRANLAEKARILRTMVTDRKATARTEQIEALELLERLFSDRRGPKELYPADNYHYNKAPRTSWPKAASDDDNPARLVVLLESTLAGCRLLQACWKSLLDLVDSKQGFQSYEKFRVTRLLGWQPLSAFSEREVTEMYLACHAIAPQHSNAFQELRSEVEEEPFKRQMALLKKRNLEAITPANATAARTVLRGIVEKAIERLRMLEAEHQEVAGILDRLQENILSVEDTKTGAGVRRLQVACNGLLIRHVEAVHKCRRSDAAGWGKTRQERERRRAKSGGSSSQDGIVTNPADQRLVLDEDGKIRTAYGFTGNVEEGLARYETEVGPQPYATTDSRPEINENAIPRLSDFARWAPSMDHTAQRDRAKIQNEIIDTSWAIEPAPEIDGRTNSDDDERRRIEDQILKADSGFANEAEHVAQVDVATIGLTTQGDRTKIENKIVDEIRAISEGGAGLTDEGSSAECGAFLGTSDSPRQIEAEPVFESGADDVVRDGIAAVELTAEGDRTKIENKTVKRKWNEAGSGARREVGPEAKAPSKERQREILDQWVTNRRLLTPQIAEMKAVISELEENVRRQKTDRKRAPAD